MTSRICTRKSWSRRLRIAVIAAVVVTVLTITLGGTASADDYYSMSATCNANPSVYTYGSVRHVLEGGHEIYVKIDNGVTGGLYLRAIDWYTWIPFRIPFTGADYWASTSSLWRIITANDHHTTCSYRYRWRMGAYGSNRWWHGYGKTQVYYGP